MDKLTANELRIGNLFYVFDNILSQVDWIQKESVSVLYDRQPNLSNGAIVSYGKIQPIPLTEEWLVRMGFEKYSDGGDLHGIDCFYCKRKLKGAISLPDFMFNGFIQIKHVHQLQNLYFALTGEELTIKSN